MEYNKIENLREAIETRTVSHLLKRKPSDLQPWGIQYFILDAYFFLWYLEVRNISYGKLL